MNVDDRTCLMCGKPLPEWSSRSRRYCDECGRKRNIEMTRARQQRETKQRMDAARLKQWLADKRYCGKCFYTGSLKYGNNLCDYILLTGQRRGCKAGVGCVKRATHG